MGVLDCAYCNHTERADFLALLANYEHSNIETKFYGVLYFNRIRWMNMRNVKCANFVLYNVSRLTRDDIVLLESYMQSNARCLKKVHIRSNQMSVINWMLNTLACNGCALAELAIPDDVVKPTTDEESHWYTAMGTVANNSVNTLCALYVDCPKDWCQVVGKSICFPALQTLQVSINSDEGMVRMCETAPNLRKLILNQPKCSYEGLAAVGRYCPMLESFTFTQFGYFLPGALVNFDVGMSAIAAGCRKLSHMTLHNMAITDVTLTAMATHCTQLEELSISENSFITDASLVKLAHSVGAHLKTLTLSECNSINGSGLVTLVMHCTNLRTLCISETPRMSSLSADNLMRAIPHLKNLTELHLYCTYMDDAILSLIAEHMPCLAELTGFAGAPERRYSVEGITTVVAKCAKLERLNLVESQDLVIKEDVVLWRTLRPHLEVSY